MSKAAANPKVSVVVTTYNRAALLPRAVRSVLAQTYEDYELIIVDDCSTDDTPEVVQRFADSRIHAVRQAENRGQSAGRKHGYPAGARRIHRLFGRRRRMGRHQAAAPGANA